MLSSYQMDEPDRVLDGDDVGLTVGIHLVDERRQGRGFPGTGIPVTRPGRETPRDLFQDGVEG